MTFAIFSAGYALCRAVDEAFDRRWARVAVYGSACALLLALALVRR